MDEGVAKAADAVPVAGETVAADAVLPTRGLRRRNVLTSSHSGDISIPKPNVEVPYQPPSAAALANSKKKTAVGKGIQPTAALTPR